MTTVLIVVSVLVGIGVLALLFKPFFGSSGEFMERVRYYFTPDITSMFQGELEDWWSSMKLAFWLVSGVVCGIATFVGLSKLLGG